MPYAEQNKNHITFESRDDDEIIAPEKAVSTEIQARAIYRRIRDSHKIRAAKYAKIQGLIDGNPPYSRDKLCRAGLQHMSNVNWRDAESIFESQAQTFWNLFNEVEFIAEFCTTVGDPTDNPQHGRVMAEEWDRIVREWDCFSETMASHQNDLLKFGSSVLFWRDQDDWRFENIDPFRFLVPERTRNHTKHITMAAVEHTYTAQELWDIYNNAKSDVWNKEALGELLVYKADEFNTEEEQYSSQYVAELQRQIRNGDYAIDDIYNDDIVLVTLLVREYDGEVSRLMFHPDETLSGGFVYEDYGQYDDIIEALYHFSYTPGEPFIHGNKGLGHKMYNTVQGIIQLENHLMDAAKRASTVLVRTRGGRNRDLKRVKFTHGGFVDIGEAEFQQNLMGANLNSNVQTVQYFAEKLSRNNNIAGLNSTNGNKTKTASEVRAEATKEAQVRKILIAKYYEQLDELFQQIVIKMLRNQDDESVKLWKERCLERGVPEEAFEYKKSDLGPNGLPKHLRVSATRASGSGSQFADQLEMQQMSSLLPTLGEFGRKEVLKDLVASIRGHKYVARYLPIEDQTDQPTLDHTLASIENNQLENGEQVIVSPSNNHAVHAELHLNRMKQAAELFQQGQYGENPETALQEIDKYFQTAGPHVTRHILHLDQDPTRKELAQRLKQEWAVLANFADMIANNANEQREAQARQAQQQSQQVNELAAEGDLKAREMQQEFQLKAQRAQAEHGLKVNNARFKHLLAQQEMSFRQELEARKAESEIALKNAEILSDIDRKNFTAQEQNKGKGEGELF